MLTIVRKVCENYSTGTFTLESVCENAGVPYRTYRNWWRKYELEGNKDGSRWAILAEVADLWEASQEENRKIFRKELVDRAEQMLMKRISGYHYDVTETTVKSKKDQLGNEILVPAVIRRTQKYALPSDRLIQFVLTAFCPEKYGKQLHVENIFNSENKYANMSLEEIDAEIARIQKQIDEFPESV